MAAEITVQAQQLCNMIKSGGRSELRPLEGKARKRVG
jgi:hypothetical protein